MAIKPLLWAKEQTVITQTVRKKNGQYVASAPAPNPLDKLVLIAIGDEASEHTWDALLGVEDIAVFVGCTRRAVQESLGRLERAGFVRCRATKVESGRSGWKRIYLLAPESPLVRKLIEVDFSTVEEISRFQMRTFRDRNAAGFVPSDAHRVLRAKQKAKQQESAGQGEGERGSSSEARVNVVHPPRVNVVHPEGERGSSSEGERGSSPFFSAGSSSPSESEGRTDGKTSSTKDQQPPAEWAQRLVLDLDYGKHKRPTPTQVDELARLVEAAHVERGLTQIEIKRHARATLNGATKTGVGYLIGGLRDHLPAPKLPPASDGDERQADEGQDHAQRGEAPSDLVDRLARDGVVPKYLPPSQRRNMTEGVSS